MRIGTNAIKEGSDRCGGWGVVCLTKRQWWNGAGGREGGGADAMMRMRSLGSSHLAGSQLLRSSSVAVSTSQDFEDKAAITAFLSKPMAQSLSILRV